MEYHSVIKRDKLRPFSVICMDLQFAKLSEDTAKERQISLICRIKKEVQMYLFTKQKQKKSFMVTRG